MTPGDFPSLAPQRALAGELFGAHGAELLAAWFDTQCARVTDPGFARMFADHLPLPHIAPEAFNHRLVETGQGRLLGGIRFYRQEVTRPFVEVVAHDFADLASLAQVVAEDWAAFAPRELRLLTAPGSAEGMGGKLDMSVFAARYSDMTPPDGRVTLAPFDTLAEAQAMVAARYEALADTQPALAQSLAPAEPDDLAEWHNAGELVVILSPHPVGLLAVSPGEIEWIAGDVVMEEVVATGAAGQGFAASAQRAWAAQPARTPNTLLIGTIDGQNLASRKSARRAGRQPVLDYVFLPLPSA